MANLLNNLISILQTILVMSISAVVILGMIVLVNALAGQRMSHRSRALIWLIFMAALIIPFSLIAESIPDWQSPSAQVWEPASAAISPLIADPIIADIYGILRSIVV